MMDRFTGGTPDGRERVIAQEPIGRMGKAEEIAATVVWLCSNEASFVTDTPWLLTAARHYERPWDQSTKDKRRPKV